jgi:hypothetical protein
MAQKIRWETSELLRMTVLPHASSRRHLEHTVHSCEGEVSTEREEKEQPTNQGAILKTTP